MPLSDDADGLLDRLYALLGAQDTAFVVDVLQDFLAELPGILRSLSDALERQDFDTLRRGAHKLRSSAYALGGIGIAETAAPLEAAAHAGEAKSLPLLLNALSDEVASYERVARVMLNRLGETS
ncbi:MAG TPA: Hpt domain-containing protein [Rhodothermales bacterium]|nr:Hpt domain-containing protein [Rhodothermales bacterium]